MKPILTPKRDCPNVPEQYVCGLWDSPSPGHVWTVPAVQEEFDFSAKRSGAVMYSACFAWRITSVAMQPSWPLALM